MVKRLVSLLLMLAMLLALPGLSLAAEGL